jgi:hypothetical protein
MRVTTESGSVYDIDENSRVCRKYNPQGVGVDAYKVYVMKAVPDKVLTLEEIYELPESQPEIGKRLYTSGKDSWWISTKVIAIDNT